jgi:hypothetical protein
MDDSKKYSNSKVSFSIKNYLMKRQVKPESY